jgi:hypothetical protein
MTSLTLSCGAIIQLLHASGKQQALNLMFFLGLLPGGATENMLSTIWEKKEWKANMDVLSS